MAKTVKRSKAPSTGSLKVSLKLDPDKVKRIQQCLKKGQLTITISRAAEIGRGGNGYQYD